MAKTWTQDERLLKTLDYLTTFNGGLAAHASSLLVTLPDDQLGNLLNVLSLEGNKLYAMFGSTTKGMAVRALLLLQRAYFFKDTWSVGNGGVKFSWGTNEDPAQSAAACKNAWINKTEGQVRAALASFIETTTPATEAVIEAAFRIKTGIINNPPPWEKLSRSMSDFPGGRVCFDGLCWWLFKAGFVSLRWMAKEKGRMVAQNANEILGWGHNVLDVGRQETPTWDPPRVRETLRQIPRGRLINWRGKGPNAGVCHWAFTLGNGDAVGVNNSSAAAGPNKTLVNTVFRQGGTEWGVFDIESMCTVYNGKLEGKGFVVATIHPHDIPTAL